MTRVALFLLGFGLAIATLCAVLSLLPKAGPKDEPTAANLIASLSHPARTANLFKLEFSPDSARLFAAGYPSGVVQIWDVAQRKEVTRIDTPPGYRGSMDYALLTPDWSTLYVPMQEHLAKRLEGDGKGNPPTPWTGEFRVWDVLSGKEKAPLRVSEGTWPVGGRIGPRGRLLVCVERPSHDNPSAPRKDVMVVWDLAAGKKWQLSDGWLSAVFAPDGKTVVVDQRDLNAKTSAVKVLDLATGKELAQRSCPEKDRFFSVREVSPDGAVVTVWLSGKRGAALEVWFLDARTLEVRGKLIGKSHPDWLGGVGEFTPDGRRYVVLGGVDRALVWDVAGQKLERTLPLGTDRPAPRLAVSPDGKTLAVGWMPKINKDLDEDRDPDPEELPQPRVSLIDLTGKTAPQVLVAPHGYVGAVAFSPDGKTLAFAGAGAVHLFDLSK